MNNLSRIVGIAIPTALSIGTALIGLRIIQNERRLAKRKMELELQLGVKNLKGY